MSFLRLYRPVQHEWESRIMDQTEESGLRSTLKIASEQLKLELKNARGSFDHMICLGELSVRSQVLRAAH